MYSYQVTPNFSHKAMKVETEAGPALALVAAAPRVTSEEESLGGLHTVSPRESKWWCDPVA